MNRDPVALQAGSWSRKGWRHCWGVEPPGPPGPAPWGSSGWPAAVLWAGGEPHRSLEAASQPCGHTSHCPFALTIHFPAAERLVPIPFPSWKQRLKGIRRLEDTLAHTCPSPGVLRGPQLQRSPALCSPEASWLKCWAICQLQGRGGVAPTPAGGLGGSGTPLEILSWDHNGLGRAVAEAPHRGGRLPSRGLGELPRVPRALVQSDGRASLGQGPSGGRWDACSRASDKARKTGMEACSCRLGMEEQACQALLASGNRPLPFRLLLSPWTDGLFLEA